MSHQQQLLLSVNKAKSKNIMLPLQNVSVGRAFAWTHTDVVGVHTNHIEYILKSTKPFKQRMSRCMCIYIFGEG